MQYYQTVNFHSAGSSETDFPFWSKVRGYTSAIIFSRACIVNLLTVSTGLISIFYSACFCFLRVAKKVSLMDIKTRKRRRDYFFLPLVGGGFQFASLLHVRNCRLYFACISLSRMCWCACFMARWMTV